MRKDQLDTMPELGSLFTFLLLLALVAVVAVALFTIAGIELTEKEGPTLDLEKELFAPAGYLVTLLVFATPIATLALGLLLVRRFFFPPERSKL